MVRSTRHLLFFFLDGLGLGTNNAESNPLASTPMPYLQNELLEGRHLTIEAAPAESRRATLLALDACLGVGGAPQSATGQAALLTGRNVPGELGYHYGPKPNPDVAAYLRNGNLFKTVIGAGLCVESLNAYPPTYFSAIESGRRIYSAIPLALVSAGLPLKRDTDLDAGAALAADFTGQGWREHLHLGETPLLSAFEAGTRMARLARACELTFFEYWLTDYAGHHQDMAAASALLRMLDEVLDGLLSKWEDDDGLVLLTSDHGNMEDLSTRGHTLNPVPALLIGAPELRRPFAASLQNLADVTPAILRFLEPSPR